MAGRAGWWGAAIVLLGLAACAEQKADRQLETARVEMDNGAAMAALKLLQQRIHDHPDDVPTLVALGRANAQLGRNQSAVLFYQDALTHDGNCVEAEKGLARIDLLQDPPRALQRLEDMKRRFPQDAQIWNDLGVAYDYARRHQEAQAAYYRALKLDPLLVSAQNNLGLSYAVSGQHEQAMAMLVPLASSADATSRIRANLAYAQFMSGNEAGARQTLMHDMSPEQADKVLGTYSQLKATSRTP